ncbi:MAG: phage holin family protein [Pseudorhodoferax sp.]
MASGPRRAAPGAGPVGALRRMLSTLLALGQTRLQLIGNEIQIEKHRALQMLAQVLLAVFCLCMALLMAVGLVLALWWEQRVAVLSILLALFAAAAFWLLHQVRNRRATQDHPFAASLAELQEDLRQLKETAQHAPQQEPR